MNSPRVKKNGRQRHMEELPTGGQQPSLCVAYLILTGTSAWAIKSTATSTPYALGTFSFLLGHSLIGFFHTTHPEPGDIVKKIFRQTAILAEAAPLAIMNAEYYLSNGFSSEIAYAHLALALLPTIGDLVLEDRTADIIDLTVLGSVGSLLYLHLTKGTGAWTGGMVALCALNHFVFKKVASRYSVPKIEIVTIGLSFFTVFALNTLAA